MKGSAGGLHNPFIRPYFLRGWGVPLDSHETIFVRCFSFLGWWLVGGGAIFLGLKSFFFVFNEKVIDTYLGLEVRNRLLFMLFEAALLVISHDNAHIPMKHPQKSIVSFGGCDPFPVWVREVFMQKSPVHQAMPHNPCDWARIHLAHADHVRLRTVAQLFATLRDKITWMSQEVRING